MNVRKLSLCRRVAIAGSLTLALLLPASTDAYSVQSHEQLIDLAWKLSIVPVLRRHFPSLTDAQLDHAHAYAYGGSAIQDLGYYPSGNQLFSDLTHYVRAGDFVETLMSNARTPDEMAFAIGALSHYVGDCIGHSVATNPSVGAEFPKLAAQYGPIVTYDENPHAHVRAEFAFDVNQVSKRRMAPSAYLEHVGLGVASDLLERSFYDIYGLSLTSLEGDRHRTVRAYRFSVRTLLPRIGYAEVLLHRKRFPGDVDTAEFKQLEALIAEADFEKGWDAYRKHAGIGTYTLAGLIFIVPKIGILSELAIRGPNAEAEERYVTSMVESARFLRKTLDALDNKSTPRDPVPNRDLDTGEKVKPGAYALTDETYASLLHRLTRNPSNLIPGALKQNIEDYYSVPDAPIVTKKDPAKWAQVQADLKVLATMPERAVL